MNRTMKLSQTWCNNKVFFKVYERQTVRCDKCTRRLLTRPVHCIGGEVLGHDLPPHKTKPKAIKRPKGDRSGARGRRG